MPHVPLDILFIEGANRTTGRVRLKVLSSAVLSLVETLCKSKSFPLAHRPSLACLSPRN